jgi:TRAP-type uncharacterized transport system fused permease subunit
MKKTMFWEWPLLLPLLVLIFLLGVRKCIAPLSFYALISILLFSLPIKRARTGTAKRYKALHEAWPSLLSLGAFSGCIGIFIVCIDLTSVGLTISAFMIEICHGILPLLPIVTMVVALILGTAIPTTACYLSLAPIPASTLHQLGVPQLAAHLLIFYYGLLSAVTPLNSIGAFTTAPIAGELLMKVVYASARLAAIVYIIPFVLNLLSFAYPAGDTGSVSFRRASRCFSSSIFGDCS